MIEELLDQRLQTQEVDCLLRTVSEILREEMIERIDLLKVDVEKSELEVLLGIDEGDWPKIRQVVVEVHDVSGRLEQVRGLLTGHGFELTQEEDPSLRSTGLYSLHATRPDQHREPTKLAATIAWSSPGRLEEDLRREARRRLPEYMVPAACVFLEELPLTANGKLDRAALERLPLPGQGDGTSASAAARVEPKSDLERDLATLFEDLLGSGHVAVTDDFFELGGHSLLAVRLMARIREHFGANLPLATLFQGGTVEHLAKAIRHGERQRPALPLVEIQPGEESVPPLFCVHPAGGNVLCYAELARALGPRQPVYGLEARGLTEGQTPHDTIEAMADEYLEAIRGLRPKGPYALLGWSLGGLVAYEMARRLKEDGDEIVLLAVLDVWARAPRQDRFASDAEMLSAALEGAVELTAEELKDLSSDESLAAVMRKATAAGVVPAGFSLSQARRYLDVFSAGRRATTSYHPHPYNGPMTLFRATGNPVPAEPAQSGTIPGNSHETLSWRRYVRGDLRVHRVPASHHTLIRPPHVRYLAQQVSQVLTEAEEI